MAASPVVVVVVLFSAAAGVSQLEQQNTGVSSKIGEEYSIQERYYYEDFPKEKLSVDGSICPPWFIWHKPTSDCVCGKSLSAIAECCSDSHSSCFFNASVMLYPCYCMTVNTASNLTSVGYCPYTCLHYAPWNANGTKLNHRTCSKWKRTGLLCEQCQKGHAPSLFSYDLHCTECPPHELTRNILLIVTYFFSLTVFCLIIIVFRISAARPPLSTFVLVCQVYSAPFQLQALSEYPEVVTTNTYEIVFGVWNLNILRPFYHSLCVCSAMDNLHTALLQYLIGIYPLIFLGLIVVIIRLHDYGCRCIAWTCKPIHWCLSRFRSNFNIRSSMTDAFSTFIILSFIKIGYTSIYILVPTRVYQPDGSYTWRSYAQPSMHYFNDLRYFPYALVAIAAIFIFCILPFMMLFFYPFHAFQRCLNACGFRCLTLRAFADAFQGCYKDGTEGSRDYRWFASVYIFTRFMMVTFFGIIKNYFIFSLFASLMSSALIASIAFLQPYKKSINVKIDTILLFGMATLFFGVNLLQLEDHVLSGYKGTAIFFISFGSAIPLIYFIVLVGHFVVKNCCYCKRQLLAAFCCRNRRGLLPIHS